MTNFKSHNRGCKAPCELQPCHCRPLLLRFSWTRSFRAAPTLSWSIFCLTSNAWKHAIAGTSLHCSKTTPSRDGNCIQIYAQELLHSRPALNIHSQLSLPWNIRTAMLCKVPRTLSFSRHRHIGVHSWRMFAVTVAYEFFQPFIWLAINLLLIINTPRASEAEYCDTDRHDFSLGSTYGLFREMNRAH